MSEIASLVIAVVGVIIAIASFVFQAGSKRLRYSIGVVCLLVAVIFLVIGLTPKAGDVAPDFTLADTTGRVLTLSQEAQDHRSVVLVFYRGYW